MADKETTLALGLDSSPVIKGLKEVAEQTKELGNQMAEQLGNKSVDAVGRLEKASQKSAMGIGGFFKNLGSQLKNDFKTAFNVGEIMAGASLAKDIGQGVSQVLELERAFGRLNGRLNMSAQSFQDFRRSLGASVAATGASLESVMPGIDVASGQGGVRDGKQLTSIGEMLAQANRSDPGTQSGALTSSVVEILKNQGQTVNASNFKSVLDAAFSARNAGGFETVGGSLSAMEKFSSHYDKNNLAMRNMSVRDYAGIATAASRGGSHGTDIINRILQLGSSVAGQEQVNSALGSSVFKNGKFDAKAFGNVDTQRFGQYSNQLTAGMGFDDDNGQNFNRTVKAFKESMGQMDIVAHGSNEAANTFDRATDNLGAALDKFKKRAVNSVSSIGSDLLHGDMKGAGSTLINNSGTLGGAVGLSALTALLLGRGTNGLMGMARGAAGGAAAAQAGVTPVYVTNISEMGGAGLGGATGGAGGLVTGAAGAAASLGATGVIAATAAAAVALMGSYKFATDENVRSTAGQMQMDSDPYTLAQQIAESVSKVTVKMNGPMTNPSSVKPRSSPQ